MFSLAVVAVFLAEGIYYYWILQTEQDVTKTDAIVIFSGARERVATGCKLAKHGYALHLTISPAGSESISRYQRQYNLPASLKMIKEDKARTTFENALHCMQIIKKHQFKSALLVTSDYHMPRSFLLMKVLLRGSNTRLFYKTAESVSYGKVGKRFKIMHNEMIKLWGSLVELVCYRLSGTLPDTPLQSNKSIRWMKSVLLYEV